MQASPQTDISRLRLFIEGDRLLSDLPALAESIPGIKPVHLVGGAVRDLLIGAPVTDLDLVTEDGVADLATRLAHDALLHERFGTAELVVDGTRIDLATARRERYSHPGALPEVSPASIFEDLARRDFTINAMAVELTTPDDLIDPHGGRTDLERGLLRVLHERSFADDPTRALRAARYAARFGFDLDPGTAGLLEEVDLNTVSRDRVEAELELMAAEQTGLEAFRLTSAWGLVPIDPDRLELAGEAVRLLDTDTWRGRLTRAKLVIKVLFGDAVELPHTPPTTPSAGVRLARDLSPADLLINRARGATWLDQYQEAWSLVETAVTGDDLILAGLPQGPAIGIGLAAALEAKLDRGIEGIEAELEVAVAAAEAALRGEPSR